jgi:mannose-1-phosphate guanylyltransferase/phosphomannomutase
MAGDTQGHFVFPAFQKAFDGMCALVVLLELLATHDVSLRKAAEGVPPFFVEHRAVPCAWDRKGEVMRLLSERAEGQAADFTDGIKMFHDGGWVLYLPDAVEPAFHLHAEGDTPDRLRQLVERSTRELAQLGGGGLG